MGSLPSSNSGPNPSSTAFSSRTPDATLLLVLEESRPQPHEKRLDAQPRARPQLLLTDRETEAQLASSAVPGVQEAAINPGSF